MHRAGRIPIIPQRLKPALCLKRLAQTGGMEPPAREPETHPPGGRGRGDAFCPSNFLPASLHPARKRIQREGASSPSAFALLSSPSAEIKTPPRATSREYLRPLPAVCGLVLRRGQFLPVEIFPRFARSGAQKDSAKPEEGSRSFRNVSPCPPLLCPKFCEGGSILPGVCTLETQPPPPIIPRHGPSLRFRFRPFTIPVRTRGARTASQRGSCPGTDEGT